MNPSTIRNQSQLMKVREAYLANLELEQRNLQKTIDAVSILKQTGQPPLAPQDTRSLNEKLGDIEKLKINLRKQLMTITDGQQTADIMNSLSNDEVQALSIAFGDVAAQLQPKYVNGVPAPIFLEYVRRFLKNYSKNVGLASGNQSVQAEDLKLTRDMMQRVIPSDAIMQELMRSIDAAPESRGKNDALLAVRELMGAIPKIDEILAAQSILSEVELSNLSNLITDALQEVPSASQMQKLSRDIIDALRSGSKSEADNILKKTLNEVKIRNTELEQLKAISEALRQEQAESLNPSNITAPSPVSAAQVDEVARIMNSTVKTVQVRTGEKRINKKGEEVFVTKPETQLVEKKTVTAKDRSIAEDVFLIDRLTVDELVAPIQGNKSTIEKINKPGLVKYFDYLSKRDTGVGLTKDELAALGALSKKELADRVIAFKEGAQAVEPVVQNQKAAAKQETAANIGGISTAAIDWNTVAEDDVMNKKIMSMDEFASLRRDEKLEYLVGIYQTDYITNPSLIQQCIDLFQMKNPTDDRIMNLYNGILLMGKVSSRLKKTKIPVPKNLTTRAEEDILKGRLMSTAEFESLTSNDQNSYLIAIYESDLLKDIGLIEKTQKIYAKPLNEIKERDILNLYNDYKLVTGMGMKKATQRSKAQNIVFGCGLAKSVSRPKKVFVEKIDFSEGLPKDKSYIPFGKYVIHKHKLTGGILQVRTVKGGAIPKLPTLGISPSLGKIIKKMVGGGLPTYDEMSSLNEDEKNTLYKVFKLSQIDKADMLPSPDKTKEESEMNRFQILKGQIQAGNDNADLIKEFKCLLMRFISGGKIPRGQGMDIVCELMSLGY